MTHMRRLMIVLSSLLIVLGLITTVYVSYRHYLFFKRLPTIRFTPQQLTLPLQYDELSVAQMRWVEVEATVTPGSSRSPNKYQEVLESEGTLVLQFGDDARQRDPAATTRRKYRGILYTAINGSKLQSTRDPLIQDLKDSGISPSKRFAVLMVAKSPWLIWEGVVKELGVLASGLVIVTWLLLQLAHLIKALFDPSPTGNQSQRLRRLALLAMATAVAWTAYVSAQRGPVLPIGSIVGFGIAAGLSQAAVLQRYMRRQSRFVHRN